MISEFKNPSKKFRPIPFWSWNDKLEQDELREQIAGMKQAGLGGYFMHARSGLKTEYLGKEWFDCIKTGIDAGKEYDLNAWIYDEEGWPSGFAGGLVPGMSADYHAKFMTIEEHKKLNKVDEEGLIGLYCCDPDKKVFHRIMDATLPVKEGEVILAVRKHTNPYYVDTLNKRAIEAFLQVTHEEYYKRYPEDFGDAMHGFFTDEPRLSCNNFGDLAWSDDLPTVFYQRYGYDIVDYLPALFLSTEGCEKYRYDFWVTVNDMFVTNYMKTIYDWCDAHNCKATGHIMMEESIFSQMTSTAGVMPFYEFLHVPGIDWLRRMIYSPVIGKQVGSVACQLGKKQVLTESFALCGWNVSFEELKWIAEWQFVNGVNQICQHLESYTIKGCRKRDYPPSLFTQQSWWKEYRQFNDYLSRICVALSEGDQTADVLLLHPMRSGYVCYDGTRTDAIRNLDRKFEEISYLLSGLHISYHFGDETIIGKYGRVRDGKFVVGRIAYKTVILPEMYAIDGKTLELLAEFKKQGGTILSMGQLPAYTNGEEELRKELCLGIEELKQEELRPYLLNKKLVALSITEQDEEIRSISYQQREAGEATLYFLVNHDQETAYHARIEVIGRKGKIVRLNAEDGTSEALAYHVEAGNTVFHLKFEPMQSYLLEFTVDDAVEFHVSCMDTVTVPLQSKWQIEKMGLNSLTLDYCEYRIDDGEWQTRTPVIKLQNILLELQRPCQVELAFTFELHCDLEKNKEFYAVIEDAQLYQISVNGTNLINQETGWWKDKTFKKVPIKSYLKMGTNTILLSTNFTQPQKVYDVLFGKNVYETEKNKITYDIEIESIYLLGDFGVISETPFHELERSAVKTEGGFKIVDAPTAFTGKDFTTQGLLFFAEDLVVSQKLQIEKQKGKRILLDLKNQQAPMIKVFVNDQLVKHSLWAPYVADITEVVKDGENKISLQLFASNRNLLGPHHHTNGECYNVGPDSFTGKWSWVERKSEADATEIVNRNQNFWTDSYNFVHFGI